MREIDCRGLACPQPVIQTKEALEELPEGELLWVLVDNKAAVKNVSRFAEAHGHSVEVTSKGEVYRLKIVKKGGGQPVTEFSCARPEGISRVVVIASDRMGKGDETLGRKLIEAFLQTLKEVSPKPQTLVFYNRGVFFTSEGSSVIDELKELERQGVEILSCWTCLSHYGLEDKLRVGQASNMYEILSRLMRASLVIRP